MDEGTIQTVNAALARLSGAVEQANAESIKLHDAMADAGRRFGEALEEVGREIGAAGSALKVGFNLRPAPFVLTEAAVRAMVDPQAPAPAGRTMAVPVVSTPLVDRPRRSEDPRLAKANDDTAAQSDIDPEPWPDAPLPDEADPDLDRPVPGAAEQDDLQLAAPPAPHLGVRVATPKAIPPLSAFQRRQRLQDAIMHLRRKCILVSVVNRDALVRKYRVSGKRDAMLAEDVIAIAISHGFEGGENAGA